LPGRKSGARTSRHEALGTTRKGSGLVVMEKAYLDEERRNCKTETTNDGALPAVEKSKNWEQEGGDWPGPEAEKRGKLKEQKKFRLQQNRITHTYRLDTETVRGVTRHKI